MSDKPDRPGVLTIDANLVFTPTASAEEMYEELRKSLADQLKPGMKLGAVEAILRAQANKLYELSKPIVELHDISWVTKPADQDRVLLNVRQKKVEEIAKELNALLDSMRG